MGIRSSVIRLLLAMSFSLVGNAPSEEAARYFPLWQSARPNLTDLVLIYQGGGQRPQWTTDRFAPYVSYRVPAGGKEQWLFDSFLFIEYQNAALRVFEPFPNRLPATKADWVELLEKNFATNDGVPNLERTCRDVAARIGEPQRRRQVVLTLPEPLAGQTNWGTLNGQALDFH